MNDEKLRRRKTMWYALAIVGLLAGAIGTRLTITERGHVYNPIFRCLAKYVFGHEATLRSFLKTLQTRVQQKGT